MTVSGSDLFAAYSDIAVEGDSLQQLSATLLQLTDTVSFGFLVVIFLLGLLAGAFFIYSFWMGGRK